MHTRRTRIASPAQPLTLWRVQRRLRGGTLLAAVAGLAASVCAQPQGAQVVHGHATFNQTGSITTITAANKTVINYSKFNIAAGATVQFVQPGSRSKVLNRVLGPDPSVIAGSLKSNGIVYIVNPAGVVFSNGAMVNVGGIYAGAGRISNADFLAGRNRFTDLNGPVENRGTISGSEVGLFGARVSNYGTIVAPQGMVAMASGREVLVGESTPGGGNFFAKVTGGAPQAGGTGVTNAGTIDAPGGRVMLGAGDLYAVAIDHSGTTKSRDIRLEGGRGGVVSVSGALDASSATATGGSVKVLGDKVGVFGGDISASGATGGGTVLLGGNQQGQGPERRASATFVSSDSTVRADATQIGDGGTIIVWSDMVTRSFGDMSARGGAGGGNGGFVETSSKHELHLAGTPDLSSAHGRGGTWLIDPEDLDIVNTPTTGVSSVGAPDTIFTSTGAGAQLFVGDLQDALVGGANVQVVTGPTGSATGGILTLQAGVTLDFNGTGTNTLTLKAHRRVTIDGQIIDGTPGGDTLNLVLTADSDGNGSGNVQINNVVQTGGGSFTSTGVDFTLASTGSIVTAGGAVSIGGTGQIRLGSAITAGAGDVTFSRPVILTSDFLVTGNDVTFSSTVNSDGTARDLTVNTTGSGVTSFLGGVGATSPLGTVTTNTDGSTVLDAAAFMADTIDLRDPLEIRTDTTVTATTSATFAAIQSQSTEANDLTVNSANTVFTGKVGSGSGALGRLATDTPGTTFLRVGGTGNSVEAAQVDFGDAVVVSSDAVVKGTTSVRFGASINSGPGGERDLTIDSPLATIVGTVGASRTLDTFTTLSGTVATLQSGSVTSAVIDLRGRTVLGADTTMVGDTSVTLGAVDSESGEANDLTINSPLTTLTGAMGQGTGGTLGTLSTDAAGTTVLSGANAKAGVVNFGDKVEVGGDSTIAGTTSVTFNSTIDNAVGAARSLTVNAPSTLFSGRIGSTREVGTLQTDAAGITTLATDTVKAGTLKLEDAVILNQDVTVSGSTLVRFGGTLDSATGVGTDLTVNSPATTFAGSVGAGTGGSLGDVVTDVAGTTTLGGSLKASSVSFADAVTLNGTVTTTGDQTYSGAVLLGSDSILAGHDITFVGTVNSGDTATPSTPHSLTVNTTGGGRTTFNGPVGTIQNLSTLFTNADGLTVLAGGSIRTSGTQTFNDPVQLGLTTTLTGTNITFGSTLDSDGIARALTVNTISTGNTLFTGAVGSVSELDRIETNSDGTTKISGGTVKTRGAQVYNDAVVLGADTILTGGGLTFGGKLDSDTSERVLALNTTNNGLTLLVDAVGATRALTRLTTNADGRTRILAPSITTSGAQNFNDAVAVGALTTLSAKNVAFNSTLDADTAAGSSALTVNTSGGGVTLFAGRVGGRIPVKGITTNADGRTRIGADVTTAGNMTFGDAVVVFRDVTLADNGSAGLSFGSTLDSDGTARALTLVPNGDSQASVANPTIARVAFIGAVGGTSPFASLALGGPRSTSPAAATIIGGLGANGSPIPNYSLTITTTGAFSMAARQKFSVLGNLTINSGGPATLSDISTLGNLSVNAPSIAVHSRPRGPELFLRDGELILGRDGGVDYVSGGSISFSQVPTVLGGSLAPAFSTPDAANIGSNLIAFPQRAFGPLTIENMRSNAAVLDLAAVGASSSNLAESIPKNDPAVVQVDLIPPGGTLTSAQVASLAGAGIDAGLAESRHIPAAAVRQFSSAYDALFFRDTVNAEGQPVREPQAEHIRSVLAASWNEYAGAAKDRADALGFRAYVEAVPEQAEARYYLNAIRDLFDRVGELGLTPAEAAAVRRRIAERLAPAALTPEQLENGGDGYAARGSARPGADAGVQVNAQALIESLASFARVLPAAVEGLSEPDAHLKPPSGAWSVVEIVCHLADEEAGDFRGRLELTLRDPSLPWPPNDPEAWSRDRRYNDRRLDDSVAKFLAERRASLDWLRGLGPQDWTKAHKHPALGALSAGDLIASWAAHDWLHLRQIAKRRHELAGRDGEGFSTAYAGQWGP